MLPDYIIYDELRRQRELEEVEQHRPHLEVPRYIPYWPDPEHDDDPSDDEERDSGVIIIQM